MLTLGLVLVGSVLVPMGFQFLAVLGGKALILAKMALILSSIQGLKKIATNGLNYGLYHQGVPDAWNDRSYERTPTIQLSAQEFPPEHQSPTVYVEKIPTHIEKFPSHMDKIPTFIEKFS